MRTFYSALLSLLNLFHLIPNSGQAIQQAIGGYEQANKTIQVPIFLKIIK